MSSFLRKIPNLKFDTSIGLNPKLGMIKTDTAIITVAMEHDITWLTTRCIGHPQGAAYQGHIGMSRQAPGQKDP